jgi:hypothetical protein
VARIIRLKYPGKCRDCGAKLEVGARARYYGRGKVYGVECHERGSGGGGGRARRGGGRVLVSTRCEDYPCCGHGPPPMGDGGGCPKRYEDGTEVWRCASCGADLKPGASSALCSGCSSRASRDYDWGPLERDPDSFFYEPQ